MMKIALEEAFYFDKDTTGTLSVDPSEIALSQGLEPSWFEPVWKRLTDLGETRIAAMDEGDIAYSILSHNAPGLQGVSNPATAVRLAKDMNNYLADAISEYPDRLGGFATLPTIEPDASASELERAVEELGFYGALVNGYTNLSDGSVRYLDEEVNEPLWTALEELDVPLYIHPRPTAGTVLSLQGHPELAGATWAFAPETSTHLLRIIFSGVLDRHPGVQIILGHLGESLPTFIARINHYFDENPFGRSIERTLAEYFSSNIHVTTSGNFNDQALIGALLGVGADNILYSVDYPFADPRSASVWFDHAPISEKDRMKIGYGNAVDLLKLPEIISDQCG